MVYITMACTVDRRLWDAAFVLAHYIDGHAQHVLRGKQILEVCTRARAHTRAHARMSVAWVRCMTNLGRSL